MFFKHFWIYLHSTVNALNRSPFFMHVLRSCMKYMHEKRVGYYSTRLRQFISLKLKIFDFNQRFKTFYFVYWKTWISLRINSANIQEYSKYKASLLFFGIVDLFHKNLNSKVLSSEESSVIWTERFANFLRHNDLVIMESCRRVLKEFEEELMVCEDWMEIFDVLGKFIFKEKFKDLD